MSKKTLPEAAFEYYKMGVDGTLPGGGGVATPSAVQGTAVDDAAASGNPVPVGGIYNGTTLPTYTDLDRTQLQFTARGDLRVMVNGGTVSGLDGVSNSSLGTVQGTGSTSTSTLRPLMVAPFVYNGTSWDRPAKPNAASRIASAAASVNATSAKGAAGNVFKIFGNNAKASVIYLKVYNKATAPTVGTDVPVLTIPIAASGRFDIDIGGDSGFYLGTGIAYGFTTDAADNGTTALLAGDILGFTLTYS